jgi:hypothetical protein
MGSQAASPSPSALDTPAGDLPLAVWPCANTSPQYQRAGRYLPASTAHPAKMTPELARRIVAEYSRPGQLVVDPLCGIGTTLVEAVALGRRAVGVELEPRWAELARANLIHAVAPPSRPPWPRSASATPACCPACSPTWPAPSTWSPPRRRMPATWA